MNWRHATQSVEQPPEERTFANASGLRLHVLGANENGDPLTIMRIMKRSGDRLLEPIVRGSLSRRRPTPTEEILRLLKSQESVNTPLLGIIQQMNQNWDEAVPFIDNRFVCHYMVQLNSNNWGQYLRNRQDITSFPVTTLTMGKSILSIEDDGCLGSADQFVIHRQDLLALGVLA